MFAETSLVLCSEAQTFLASVNGKIKKKQSQRRKQQRNTVIQEPATVNPSSRGKLLTKGDIGGEYLVVCHDQE